MALRRTALKSSNLAFTDRARRISNRFEFFSRSSLRACPNLKIEFQVPYKAQFGQTMKLVGTGDLGDWDLDKAVSMDWMANDVWRTTVVTRSPPGHIFQYKFVLVDPDGSIVAWKPGPDIILRMPATTDNGTSIVRVLDTWDGSVHEVAVETDADFVSPGREDLFMEALKSSYQDLELKLNAAQSLLDSVTDPASRELLSLDRDLALAASKAIALTKVADASEN